MSNRNNGRFEFSFPYGGLPTSIAMAKSQGGNKSWLFRQQGEKGGLKQIINGVFFVVSAGFHHQDDWCKR